MTWLSDLVPPPDARKPLTLPSCFRYVVTPFLCFYATAILVLIPNTLVIRLAILPLSLYAFFTGATRLDLTKTYNDASLAYLNQSLVIIYSIISMRIIVWSMQTQLFWRVQTLAETTPDFYAAGPPPLRLKHVFRDAFDLCHNLRGCGWKWSRHLKIPRETRPTSSARAFAIATSTLLLQHLVMLDVFQYAIQWISPLLRTATGGSIFDANLPPSSKYPTSVLLMGLSGWFLYSFMQATYYSITLFGVLLFRQDISLWPPAFDAPWKSTSFTEFWSRRWHQLLRDVCISFGQKPMLPLFGRAGGVFGTFLTSGIFHSLVLWGMGRGTDFVHVTGFFVAHGVVLILEETWRKFTGHQVGGWYGMVWTWLWYFGTVGIIMDAWATRGIFGSSFLPLNLRLTTHILGPLS